MSAITQIITAVDQVFSDAHRFDHVKEGWQDSNDVFDASHGIRHALGDKDLENLFNKWKQNWQSAGGGVDVGVHACWSQCPQTHKKLEELRNVDLARIHGVAVRVDSFRKIADALHQGFKAAEAELDAVWGGKAAEAARKQFAEFGKAAKAYDEQAKNFTAHIIGLRNQLAKALDNFNRNVNKDSSPFKDFLKYYYNDGMLPGWDAKQSRASRDDWNTVMDCLGKALHDYGVLNSVLTELAGYAGDSNYEYKTVPGVNVQDVEDTVQDYTDGSDQQAYYVLRGFVQTFHQFNGWYNLCVDQHIKNTDELYRAIESALKTFAVNMKSLDFNQFAKLTHPGGNPPGKPPGKDPFNGKPPKPSVPNMPGSPTSPSGSPSTPKTPHMPSMKAPKAPDMPSSATPKTPHMPSMKAPKAPDMPKSPSPKMPDMPKSSTPKMPEMSKSDMKSKLDDSNFKPKGDDFRPENYHTPDFKSPKFGGTSAASFSPHSFDPKEFAHSTKGLGSLGATSPSSSHGGGLSAFGAGGLGGGLGKGETASSSGSRKGSLGSSVGGGVGSSSGGPVAGTGLPGAGDTGSGPTEPAAAGAAGGAAGAKPGGAGGGMMGGMGGAGKGQGGDEKEHKRKFKYNANPDELFGSDEKAVPPVIGGDVAPKPKARR